MLFLCMPTLLEHAAEWSPPPDLPRPSSGTSGVCCWQHLRGNGGGGGTCTLDPPVMSRMRWLLRYAAVVTPEGIEPSLPD
jgi:hypothetical protein